MNTDFQLRVATEVDAADLLRMMAPFNAGEGIPFDADQFRGPLLSLLRDEKLGAVLLFEAGAILGYAVVAWSYDLEYGGRDAFLTEFWLEPESRGTGLGRRALAAVEEFARVQGAHALHLGVRPGNSTAVRLYETSGYTDWPRRFLSKLL